MMRWFLLVFIFLMSVGYVQAAVIPVDDDGPAQYSRIQDAINAAVDGDIVEVSPGHYYENIDFRGKAITVKSTDPSNPSIVETTIIDANGSGIVVSFHMSEGLDSIFSGFTVTGGYAIYGAGICCWGDSAPKIINSVITENKAKNIVGSLGAAVGGWGGAVAGNTQDSDSMPVDIPDANFKAAVEAALGITNPTPEDMLELIYLDAWSSGIVDITGIGYAVNLTTLDLYWNQLSSLPAEIGNLTNLTNLDLGWNQLSSLPVEIWNLTNLTNLYLTSNQLSNLPAEIGNLTNLTTLDLWGNQLSSLPAEIGTLTNLTALSLWGNQLSSLPVEIGNLTNLAYLYLRGNPLNTEVYCDILPIIINNNPGIYIYFDPNPNPMTEDCLTDLEDLVAFMGLWLAGSCDAGNNWCDGADMDHVNDVDLHDFSEFSDLWLGLEL